MSLSAREWRDLLHAQRALVVAQLRLRTRPEGELLHEWTTERATVAGNPAHLSRAREIGVAVRRVSLHGLTRPRCLARAMAICDMLAAEGVQGAIVRIGVRPENASLIAHAWVELCGEIIGDSRAHVRDYALLATAQGATKR